MSLIPSEPNPTFELNLPSMLLQFNAAQKSKAGGLDGAKSCMMQQQGWQPWKRALRTNLHQEVPLIPPPGRGCQLLQALHPDGTVSFFYMPAPLQCHHLSPGH